MLDLYHLYFVTGSLKMQFHGYNISPKRGFREVKSSRKFSGEHEWETRMHLRELYGSLLGPRSFPISGLFFWSAPRTQTSGLIQMRNHLWLAGKSMSISRTGLEAIFRRKIEIWGNGGVYDSRHDSHESCGKKKENCCCCCNAVDDRHIYVYGEKAKSDGLFIALKQFTGSDLSVSDEISSYLCRSCVNKVLDIKSKIKELKSLFGESEEARKCADRVKRGRKDEESFPQSHLRKKRKCSVFWMKFFMYSLLDGSGRFFVELPKLTFSITIDDETIRVLNKKELNNMIR